MSDRPVLFLLTWDGYFQKNERNLKIVFFNFSISGGDILKEWLFDQVYHFNVIIFISIMVFNVALSKQNTQKLIKNQSQELYLEIEEVKDTIRELRRDK